MTGKDLIMYILENNLENELLFDKTRVGQELLGFTTVMDAAIRFGVGVSTIQTWYKLGMIEGFEIGDTIFIQIYQKNPMEEGKDA